MAKPTSLSIEVSLNGLPEAQAELRKKDSRLRQKARLKVIEIANRIAAEAKMRAPKGSGPAKSRTQKKFGHGMIAERTFTRPYENATVVGDKINSTDFRSPWFESGIDKPGQEVRAYIRRKGNATHRAVAQYMRKMFNSMKRSEYETKISPQTGKPTKYARSDWRYVRQRVMSRIRHRGYGREWMAYLYTHNKGRTGAYVDGYKRHQFLPKRPHISIALKNGERSAPSELERMVEEAMRDG